MWFLKGKLGNRFDNVNKDDGLYWDGYGYGYSFALRSMSRNPL